MFSCTDPVQNQLRQDTCISMVPGNPIWASPDIILTSSLGVPNEARKGEPNTVTVRARKSCDPAGTTNVLVELWVANPSLNFAPNINSVNVFNDGVLPTGSFNPTAQVSRTWTAEEVLSNPVQTDPDPNRLHRCLVARCYPSNLNPPETKFCVGEDPHVAQLNIAIVRVQRLKMSFPIQTIGKNLELIEASTIRVFADRVPNPAVLNAILPSLRQFEGFRQIAQIAPEGFALQVPENLAPEIRDYSHLENPAPISPGDIPFRDICGYVFRDGFSFERFSEVIFNPSIVLQEAVAVLKFNAALALNWRISSKLAKLVERVAPTWEADIKLPAQEVVNFTFTANLPEVSRPGDAHIFHAMHIDENQRVIGGLTLVGVV